MNEDDNGQPGGGRLRDLARRILSPAVEGGRERQDAVATAIHAYATIRARMSQFFGPSGFDALMSRSLAMSAAERPELSQLRLGSGGTIDGLDEYAAGLRSGEALETLEFVFTQFLLLVSSFIGEALTERLLGELGSAELHTYYDAIPREAQR